MAARKILSDYYFDDSTTGEAPKGTLPPRRTPDTDMDKACSTSKTAEKWSWGDWICQPRWTSTRGMVRFHNATAGQKVINWQSKGSNVIAFDRDREGFMAINNQLTDVTATFATSLAGRRVLRCIRLAKLFEEADGFRRCNHREDSGT